MKKRNCNNFFGDQKGKKVQSLFRLTSNSRFSLISMIFLTRISITNVAVCNVRFLDVAGKCYLMFSENLDIPIDEWTARGPHRFYFTQSYNVSDKSFDEPPSKAMAIGQFGKGKTKAKGKGKIKGKTNEENELKKLINKPIDDPPVFRKLQTLDVFAGCGGEFRTKFTVQAKKNAQNTRKYQLICFFF